MITRQFQPFSHRRHDSTRIRSSFTRKREPRTVLWRLNPNRVSTRSTITKTGRIPPSHLHCLPCFSTSLRFVTQIRGRIGGTPTLSPLRYTPPFLSREKGSAIPSLANSCRVFDTHARRSLRVNFCTVKNLSERNQVDSYSRNQPSVVLRRRRLDHQVL